MHQREWAKKLLLQITKVGISMENVFSEEIEPVYETTKELLVLGDTFSILEKMIPGKIDMIFADPPYF